ncbi:anaerobic sulfatase maturase [Planctomycetota bacterium]
MFSLLIKPSGSDCDLNCGYCFYKNRPSLTGSSKKQRMSEDILEKLIADFLSLGFQGSVFAFQGGEPTLMGLDFYKKVVQLQKKHSPPGQIVSNSLQTNAVLLDDDWCQFLHDNQFLVGISLDGPKKFHDHYRLDHSGKGSFDKVIKAIDTCKKHKVEYNILTLLNDKNVEHPDELFDFFAEMQVEFLQFIPCVETDSTTGKVADFSITPAQYGDFLCRIFDRWRDYEQGKLHIRDFDSILSFCLRGSHTICTFSKKCSQYIVVEHNGDVFCCDFFVEPKWRLGNILETPTGELAGSEKKRIFARNKQKLCNKCLICQHLDICRGGCVKDRKKMDQSVDKLSYFCESYKRFFDYSIPKFLQIAANIKTG